MPPPLASGQTVRHLILDQGIEGSNPSSPANSMPAHTARMVRSTSGLSPRARVAAEVARRGHSQVVTGCIALLDGRMADPELIVALGGPPASWALTGEPSGPDYWLRVWAARGLLWAWEPRAERSILRALRDDAWRVREGAVRVVARHRLDDARSILTELEDDPNARVRSAASRAMDRFTARPRAEKRCSAKSGGAT
jgi:HEAT repeats